MADEHTDLGQQTDTAAEQETSSQQETSEASGAERATSLLTDDQDTEEKATEGETSEEADDKGEEKEGEKGAPEAYEDFEIPEEFSADPEFIKGFGDTFRDLDLSQKQAQSLVDRFVELEKGRIASQEKLVVDQQVEWQKQAKADPGFEQTNAHCKAALKEFGNEGVVKLLGGVWGDHPDIRAFLAKVGASVSEGGFVESKDKGEPTEQDKLKARYPSMYEK